MGAPLDLGPIKERAAKATDGPFVVVPHCLNVGKTKIVSHLVKRFPAHHDCAVYIANVGSKGTQSDAEFFAQSRTDVPSLIAEVERLRAENDRLGTDVAARYDHGQVQIAEIERLRAVIADCVNHIDYAAANIVEDGAYKSRCIARITALADAHRGRA